MNYPIFLNARTLALLGVHGGVLLSYEGFDDTNLMVAAQSDF